jgi:hypothetical protein
MNSIVDYAAKAEQFRRTSAGALYQLLYIEATNSREDEEKLTYDGDHLVTFGPIRVNFVKGGIQITFPDPCADNNSDYGPVILHIPGGYTFGALVAIVRGLHSFSEATS